MVTAVGVESAILIGPVSLSQFVVLMLVGPLWQVW